MDPSTSPGRGRLAVGGLLVVVVVLAVLTRCGAALRASSPQELPWQPGQRHLVIEPHPSDSMMTALIGGRLVELTPGSDPACLAVGDDIVVWPPGYRLSAAGEVLRGDGSVALRVGGQVQVGGGLRGDDRVPGDTCPAGHRWEATTP